MKRRRTPRSLLSLSVKIVRHLKEVPAANNSLFISTSTGQQWVSPVTVHHDGYVGSWHRPVTSSMRPRQLPSLPTVRSALAFQKWSLGILSAEVPSTSRSIYME